MASEPPITIRLPSKYTSSSPSTTPFNPPPLPFLHRTWSVTHSTLSMWRTAQNVRITYGPLPSKTKGGEDVERVSDLVEYEALSKDKEKEDTTNGGEGGTGARDGVVERKKGGKGKGNKVKRIQGVDTAVTKGDGGAWDWRGSGLLFFVGSHWEVLGWGERPLSKPSSSSSSSPSSQGQGENGGGAEPEVERWVVTWFAPTVFTAEGLDVYSDRREGPSEGLARDVLAELERVCKGQGKLGVIVERDMREVAIRLPWGEA
ncbi:uncharacterized protein C8A04DRAFT_31660 [Dichotomopilus funicola]|uniref:Uncharacterized protein n=1 Tax=Dichotomopilus funicola TaxID=1934379 RepID=A0AAN6UXE2_9PEZI|nr:hypothetical protein C8A04DRAFT_31660 [Dichotomopilus funicola]